LSHGGGTAQRAQRGENRRWQARLHLTRCHELLDCTSPVEHREFRALPCDSLFQPFFSRNAHIFAKCCRLEVIDRRSSVGFLVGGENNSVAPARPFKSDKSAVNFKCDKTATRITASDAEGVAKEKGNSGTHAASRSSGLPFPPPPHVSQDNTSPGSTTTPWALAPHTTCSPDAFMRTRRERCRIIIRSEESR